ncbi:MAG: alcohol dehydrogenase catalytic domain-containing protein [Candidatus Omnitrophica bacterium]|nr:alcohol dehydrogenase catalytic domain-containing protein [Candidatus Omnitrophota bacterium]MCM8802096.1 alcohol dehydrogenase catalytic domain-containing protein [Candidatus Omnitrophota bacterium]
MKVAISEGKGDVKIKEVPIPEINDYQCLCKTLACATCSGTDLKIMDGKIFWCKNYPVILGHESVGIVVKRGKKVKYIKTIDFYETLGYIKKRIIKTSEMITHRFKDDELEKGFEILRDGKEFNLGILFWWK